MRLFKISRLGGLSLRVALNLLNVKSTMGTATRPHSLRQGKTGSLDGHRRDLADKGERSAAGVIIP